MIWLSDLFSCQKYFFQLLTTICVQSTESTLSLSHAYLDATKTSYLQKLKSQTAFFWRCLMFLFSV